MTAVRDRDARGTTNMAGVDLRYRPGPDTELRAEIAGSTGRADPGALDSQVDVTGTKSGRGARGAAWLVEAEHHGARVDALAYAREQAADFGVGQLNRSETATRKVGVDGRLRIGSALGLSASAYREEQLDTDARRVAARGEVGWRLGATTLRAGLALTDDRLADGTAARSSIVQLGASRRLLGNRLELDAQTEFALGGEDGSIDFPARRRLGARYAVTPDVQLTGSYEIADGKAVDARTLRVGFDVRPWTGGRLLAAVNEQSIAEYGPRSFAAFGLSQSVRLGGGWSVDASLDGSRTLRGIDPARVLNPARPVASGGFLGSDGSLAEDFTAVTAGATYRADAWSATGRAEYRAGDEGDRAGLTAAVLRQIGEGRALGAAVSWGEAERDGVRTEAVSAALSWAHRPAASRWSLLEKLELRSDRVRGAVPGEPGPLGGAALLVGGDAATRRVVNSLSVNWYGTERAEDEHFDRGELSLFWGSRYVFDRYDDLGIGGWSNLVGVDGRVDLAPWLDLGGSASARQGGGGRSLAYAVGPALGLRPFRNGWLSVGYNLVGFDDRDFGEARYTRDGPYATVRFKFDQTGFQELGLLKR